MGRTELFFSKSATLAAHCLIVPAILVGVGLVAGYRASRFAPLAGAGGVPVSVGRSIAHVWSGAGLVAWPLMGLSAFAILLSTTTQSSLSSGVGALVLILLLRLASSLGLAGPLDPYLLTNQFEAWLTSPATL